MNTKLNTQHICEALLDYEPTAPGGKGGNPWWLILRCDEGIVRYYQWWIERHHHIKIERPLFGSHVSVMRGEEPSTSHEEWKVRQDEVFALSYSHELQTADGFWWLPVSCPEMEALRCGFGLSPQPEHGYHLTIGRTRP